MDLCLLLLEYLLKRTYSHIQCIAEHLGSVLI